MRGLHILLATLRKARQPANKRTAPLSRSPSYPGASGAPSQRSPDGSHRDRAGTVVKFGLPADFVPLLRYIWRCPLTAMCICVLVWVGLILRSELTPHIHSGDSILVPDSQGHRLVPRPP